MDDLPARRKGLQLDIVVAGHPPCYCNLDLLVHLIHWVVLKTFLQANGRPGMPGLEYGSDCGD